MNRPSLCSHISKQQPTCGFQAVICNCLHVRSCDSVPCPPYLFSGASLGPKVNVGDERVMKTHMGWLHAISSNCDMRAIVGTATGNFQKPTDRSIIYYLLHIYLLSIYHSFVYLFIIMIYLSLYLLFIIYFIKMPIIFHPCYKLTSDLVGGVELLSRNPLSFDLSLSLRFLFSTTRLLMCSRRSLLCSRSWWHRICGNKSEYSIQYDSYITRRYR